MRQVAVGAAEWARLPVFECATRPVEAAMVGRQRAVGLHQVAGGRALWVAAGGGRHQPGREQAPGVVAEVGLHRYVVGNPANKHVGRRWCKPRAEPEWHCCHQRRPRIPGNSIDGKGLPAIHPIEPLTLDVTIVGSTFPSERLAVILRLR